MVDELAEIALKSFEALDEPGYTYDPSIRAEVKKFLVESYNEWMNKEC